MVEMWSVACAVLQVCWKHKPPDCLRQNPTQTSHVYTPDYVLARQMLLLSKSDHQVVIFLCSVQLRPMVTGRRLCTSRTWHQSGLNHKPTIHQRAHGRGRLICKVQELNTVLHKTRTSCASAQKSQHQRNHSVAVSQPLSNTFASHSLQTILFTNA